MLYPSNILPPVEPDETILSKPFHKLDVGDVILYKTRYDDTTLHTLFYNSRLPVRSGIITEKRKESFRVLTSDDKDEIWQHDDLHDKILYRDLDIPLKSSLVDICEKATSKYPIKYELKSIPTFDIHTNEHDEFYSMDIVGHWYRLVVMNPRILPALHFIEQYLDVKYSCRPPLDIIMEVSPRRFKTQSKYYKAYGALNEPKIINFDKICCNAIIEEVINPRYIRVVMDIDDEKHDGIVSTVIDLNRATQITDLYVESHCDAGKEILLRLNEKYNFGKEGMCRKIIFDKD